MSYENWLNCLRNAEKSSIISGRLRKVFYKFQDGQTMVEEYSMDTGVAQRRVWRKCKHLMGEPEWEVELGEMPPQLGDDLGNRANYNAIDSGGISDFTLKESNTEPLLSKRMTKKNIEWRIRNLPYPLEVYQVHADAEKKAILVRTTNKKYYKVIRVPELDRCCLLPEQSNISLHHQFNTLIITYRKPEILREMDAMVLIMLKDIKTEKGMDEVLQGLLRK